MELLSKIFGEGSNLEWWQMCARAAVVFVLSLILIRISGRRSFGMRSAFDNCIAILLGAILARAVIGASPFVPTLMAALTLVILHRLMAWICVRNPKFDRIANGSPMLLFREGKILEKNLDRSLVTEDDIKEGLRQIEKTNDFREIDEMYLERNGRISVVKKQ
jgi:uncharacterized membrane protein YcaP (DUF421 family)